MTAKIVTFNIRYKSDSQGHSIPERAPRIEETVRLLGADLICLQEYTPAWEAEISARFGGEYDIFVKYRDETEDIEASPVLWHRERFELVGAEYFWLSDTPEVKSRGWDTACSCYRMCVCVTLRDRKAGKTIAVMNTHLGLGSSCHEKSVRLILSRAEKYANMPLLIAGDFNFSPESSAYGIMTARFADANAFTARDIGATDHGYGREREHIDYIFFGNGSFPTRFFVDRRSFGGKYASDHYALFAELEY